MTGPSADYRERVAKQMDRIDNEAALDQLLDELEGAVSEDSDGGKPDEDLAAVESWASIASYAVSRFYTQKSLRRDYAGWGKRQAKRLRRIADKLADILRGIVGQVGAIGFSVGIAFPGGVSIALNW
ncbi:MAG TPA: hypothetical protein VK701_05315 [Solirubrobacteraceae bacterium]|jgi:hypothetical protein|nr:hypothetical protein [Solirubrobacteraceae bacterium]